MAICKKVNAFQYLNVYFFQSYFYNSLKKVVYDKSKNLLAGTTETSCNALRASQEAGEAFALMTKNAMIQNIDGLILGLSLQKELVLKTNTWYKSKTLRDFHYQM